MRADGLILAGGKSSRMGGMHKGNLIYQEDTFVERIIKELKKETEQIWISYGQNVHSAYEDCRIVMDEYPGCGPISGLHAGLKQSRNEIVLVAACDMPFLNVELYHFLIKYMETQYDGVVPILDGRMQPLAAIYRKNISGKLEDELVAGNYKLSRVWKKMNFQYVDISEKKVYRKMLRNINTIEEYNEIGQNA